MRGAAARTDGRMLASHVMHFRSSARIGPVVGALPARNARSVDSVLEAAGVGINAQATAELATALQANRITFAWQLEQLDSGDWDKLNVSISLKVAVKAELANPSHALATSPDAEEMPDWLRRFLLMPVPGYLEPQPMGELSAPFLSILITAPADRQHLMIVLCEMLALASGLFLTIPMGMRRGRAEAAAPAKGWDVPPSLDDGMEALLSFTIIVPAITMMISVALAFAVAFAGWHGSFQFYRSAMFVFSVALILFLFGGVFELLILVFWQLFTEATCPYPLIGVVLLVSLMWTFVQYALIKFQLDAVPLEMYHMPRWMQTMFKQQPGAIPLRARFRDEALKPAAERRAAELRARCGIIMNDIESASWSA